ERVVEGPGRGEAQRPRAQAHEPERREAPRLVGVRERPRHVRRCYDAGRVPLDADGFTVRWRTRGAGPRAGLWRRGGAPGGCPPAAHSHLGVMVPTGAAPTVGAGRRNT